MTEDRYGQDVLAGFTRRRAVSAPRRTDAVAGLVVEDAASGFVGAIVRVTGGSVELEDRRGKVRLFPLDADLLVEGERVVLAVPAPGRGTPARTRSGSIAAAPARARVAAPSRIFVEGRHDAELVEKVWGADLRVEGVVVEYLEGIDNLAEVIREFAPGRGRRVGVLVDHLVPGSKESRIAEAVNRGPHGAHVLIVGHPFVDIWQAVKPARVGRPSWPVVPRNVDWKHGICASFGWPHASPADIGVAWQRILGSVNSYADLEPVLLGRVEELIDFVTAEGAPATGR